MKPIIFIVIKLLLIITITLLVDKHAIWSVQNILELGKTDRPDPSGWGQYTRFPAGCGPAGRTPRFSTTWFPLRPLCFRQLGFYLGCLKYANL